MVDLLLRVLILDLEQFLFFQLALLQLPLLLLFQQPCSLAELLTVVGDLFLPLENRLLVLFLDEPFAQLLLLEGLGDADALVDLLDLVVVADLFLLLLEPDPVFEGLLLLLDFLVHDDRVQLLLLDFVQVQLVLLLVVALLEVEVCVELNDLVLQVCRLMLRLLLWNHYRQLLQVLHLVLAAAGELGDVLRL